MRQALAATLWVASVSIALASTGSPALPPEIHPGVARAIEKADQAINQGSFQQALAILHATVYTGGVTVRVDESGLGDLRPIAHRAVTRGIRGWETALGADNPIRLVAPHQSAQVVIKFVDRVPDSDHDACGLIQLEKQYRWNSQRFEYEVKGTIYVQKSVSGKPLTEDHLTEIICHELGHLLGLADVDDHGVLMGPMVMSQATLEPASHEVRAVKVLRERARNSIATINRSLSKPRSQVG